jgi:hypothetical protein
MSSIAEAEPGSAEDQAYFRAVEEAFLSLRGRATLLAPEDWQVAAGWRRSGVPVELVVNVMSALFARQRERKSKRGISSLRYFRAAVEAAWDERLTLLAGGAMVLPPPLAPEERLRRLGAALPEGVPGVGPLREAILAARGDLGEIETRLTELEGAFLTSLVQELSPADRAKVRERVARSLAQVPAFRGEAAAEELRARLERQALRALFHLPVLSLFAPEAEDSAS